METCGHKIVIVEDEGLIAADLQGRLERVGYQVSGVASSGDDALQVIRTHSPDLILMDIRLDGDLDGIQVADKVRQDFDIPVIYLTAFEDRETLRRASETQAFGYIKKPITSASLQGSIELAISKHRHERYLREQRDWLSATFSALPGALVVTDRLGRICYLNHLAEELTGCRVEPALGRLWTELLPFTRSDGRPLEDLMPAVLLEAAPVPLPADLWLQPDSDRRIAIEGSLAPRWRDGRMDGIVILFRDVTLARFERAQDKQDATHESISRVADGIACQLDFELSVVAAEAARLLESMPPHNGLRPAAESIESAASEAFAITSRLRAFSQNGVEPGIVRVHEILSRLEATWKSNVPGFSLRLDSDTRPVHADSRELARTLQLVLDHVRRHTHTHSSVVMSASRPKLEGLREWVRIRIAYTSTNENASSVQRLFDPSWDGNWEGLPFAYGLIRRMDGFMNVSMERDRRVHFDIYLPSVKFSAAGVTPEDSAKPVILVIAANSEARRILRSHFEEHGYGVLEAPDSSTALSVAAAYPGQIALAIANLSGEDRRGTEFARELLAKRPGICVRVVEGYRERPTSGVEPSRQLTKWELLDWANNTLRFPAKTAAGH